MKIHSDNFKETIKYLGRMQDVRITYTLNNKQFILDGENINSVTPNYEASLLKSVMKGLDIDSNIDIPLGTEIKFEYGLLVNGAYEYLDYGNYIVYSSEKQEDTLSYKITCYDKMLYSMKDYEHIDITYPCTIKQYLVALCNKIGLQFKDSDFANASRQITNELFMTINEDGTYSSMGYTYRDVLDQIAETTGGCICMTLDDKVEVRYINKAINYETSKKSTNIEFESSVKEIVKIKELDGKSTQDGTQSPEFPSEIKSVGDDVNLFDGELELGNINSSGNANNTTMIRSKNYNIINPAKDFIVYSPNYSITDSDIQVFFYDENKKYISNIWKINFTTPDNAKYYRFKLLHNTDTLTKVKLQKGTVATSYSEYGKGTVTIEQTNEDNSIINNYVIPLSASLRSLPNGTKDTIEEDGIHRKIYYISSYNNEELPSNVYEEINGIKYCNDKSISSTGQFSIGAEVQYELAEEVVEPFTEEQLEVINSIETQKGTNIFELESNAILNYPVNYDTINEQYINDVNVNFGEKYRTN